jgi:flagellar biosynthesis/type III secretory pathway M-ring protein FliF/YscJ
MSEEKEQVDVTGFAGIDLSSFKKIWGNLTTPVRVAVLAVAAIMVIIIGVLVITHLASPPMEVLFSELDPEQAQTIVAELEESGVPYQVGTMLRLFLCPARRKIA